jgi:dihydroorotate dehydrogenase
VSALPLVRDVLATTVAGIPFQNPVLLAAGTAAYGREINGVIDLEALGGIITKAVSVEPVSYTHLTLPTKLL